MFIYPFKSKVSQWAGLTVSGETVTLFERNTQFAGDIELSNLAVGPIFKKLKQCSPEISDARYSTLQSDMPEHSIRNPHKVDSLLPPALTELPPALTEKNGHYHLVHNGVVTVEELSCLLGQIDGHQNNHLARQQDVQSPDTQFRKFIAESLSRKSIEIDTQTDLLPASEIPNIIQEYKEFLSQHIDEVQQQYEQTQQRWQQHLLDTSWADEFSILANTAWQAGKQNFIFGLGFDILSKTLRKAGVKDHYCNAISHVISLAFVAYANTTWLPVLIAMNALVYSKMFKPNQTYSYMLNIAIGVATAVTNATEYSAFGFLNLGVAFVAGSVAGTAGNRLIDAGLFAYKKLRGNEIPESASESVSEKPLEKTI